MHELNLVAKIAHRIFEQEAERLEQLHIFGFHILVSHVNTQNVLVKRPGEVALEKFIIVNRFRHHVADKVEVAKGMFSSNNTYNSWPYSLSFWFIVDSGFMRYVTLSFAAGKNSA